VSLQSELEDPAVWVTPIIGDMTRRYIPCGSRGGISAARRRWRCRDGSSISLTEKDWHEVQAGVEVKRVPGPDGEETFVLARRADRRKKE